MLCFSNCLNKEPKFGALKWHFHALTKDMFLRNIMHVLCSPLWDDFCPCFPHHPSVQCTLKITLLQTVFLQPISILFSAHIHNLPRSLSISPLSWQVVWQRLANEQEDVKIVIRIFYQETEKPISFTDAGLASPRSVVSHRQSSQTWGPPREAMVWFNTWGPTCWAPRVPRLGAKQEHGGGAQLAPARDHGSTKSHATE